jgi:hypothetical protein
MPCRRGKDKTCHRPIPGKNHVLEVFSHGLGISQVMVLLDKAVAELLQRAPSHLVNRDGRKLPQKLFDGALVNFHPLRRASVQERIHERSSFPWGKTDSALSFQVQQEPPADHVLGLAVWLGPVPCKTQSPRQGTPTILRVLDDHLPDKSNIRW